MILLVEFKKCNKQQARERAETGLQSKDFWNSVCMIHRLQLRIQVLDPRVSTVTKYPGKTDVVQVYRYMPLTWNSKMVDDQNEKFIGSIRFIPFTPSRVHGNTALRCRIS